MLDYIHILAFGLPFLVALIVLIRANLPERKKNSAANCATVVETTKEISRHLSVPMSRKHYAFY